MKPFVGWSKNAAKDYTLKIEIGTVSSLKYVKAPKMSNFPRAGKVRVVPAVGLIEELVDACFIPRT
jgi:hypothetical protein